MYDITIEKDGHYTCTSFFTILVKLVDDYLNAKYNYNKE